MTQIKLPGNKKTPSAMLRVLMFGSKQLDGGLPNESIFHVSFPPVNTTLYSYAQQWITFYRSPIRCEFVRFVVVPAYHKNNNKVTDIKGTIPRTVRQFNWNHLDRGNLVQHTVFTMLERAVEPLNFKVIHRFIHRN